MRKAKQKDMTFVLGTFNKKKFKGHPTTFCFKKSQVARRARGILGRNGHCWLKIIYGKYLDNDGKKSIFYNDGVYRNFADLKKAISLFTEKPLLDYLRGEDEK